MPCQSLTCAVPMCERCHQPIIMFAFSCQANIFSILEEQIDQRRETDFRVVNIAVTIETVIYCVSGHAETESDGEAHELELEARESAS